MKSSSFAIVQWAFVVALSLVAGCGKKEAKPQKINLPANAYLNSANGWNCERGYRKAEAQCLKVVIPQNANPTNDTYGQGWSCVRGFVERGNACERIATS